MADECIVGIDLGTTLSEVSAFLGGGVRVLGPGSQRMLPSCVALNLDGGLLVGETARNQHLLHPDRTVRSVKRRMGAVGADAQVRLGDWTFTPQEISAIILRELVRWAELRLQAKPRKAVITVPAYFSDAQRQATREAGELAELEVVRILNEPTAASLAYGYAAAADASRRTVMVYDLGGGTFDVSIVTVEGDVTEVLASHGNNRLGGDDFDRLVFDRLCRELEAQHGPRALQGQPATEARLLRAAEEAKKRLSSEPYVRVREADLPLSDSLPAQLDLELSREEYEGMIRPLLLTTLESVAIAMREASVKADALHAILLVGGSTRTPLVSEMLEREIGIRGSQDVHPDLCVALGAGVLASRLAGHGVERVLVDVSPFSFGPSHLGTRGGFPYPHCYRPVIRRNTPLPVTRTERYFTCAPNQTKVELDIYQGEDEDALKNVLVGSFTVEGLTPVAEPSDVLCRMSLDLDGILRVSATEKRTGLSRHITIDQAARPRSASEVASARRRLDDLFAARSQQMEEGPHDAEDGPDGEDGEEGEGPWSDAVELPPAAKPAEAETHTATAGVVETRKADEARTLLARSRAVLPRMHAEDREEAIDHHEAIEKALALQDEEALDRALAPLRELLYFVEMK